MQLRRARWPRFSGTSIVEKWQWLHYILVPPAWQGSKARQLAGCNGSSLHRARALSRHSQGHGDMHTHMHCAVYAHAPRGCLPLGSNPTTRWRHH